ncbi:sulfurtransferase complex subunit TusB [Moellerella wisconsensis]|uniref:sulfurtransferase complex subunit TusB n=1 Tax=Moellerella wisconsensis TaxID=158849 RepID=UPI00307623D2
MLYTIASSPFNCDFAAIVSLLTPEDEVLLIQDGVLAATNAGYYLATLQEKGVNIFALRDDVEARGLQTVLSIDVPLLTYQQFVLLTVKHSQHFAW